MRDLTRVLTARSCRPRAPSSSCSSGGSARLSIPLPASAGILLCSLTLVTTPTFVAARPLHAALYFSSLLGVFTPLRLNTRLRGRRARPRGAERAGVCCDGTPEQFGVECVVHTLRPLWAQHSQHARNAQELRNAGRSRDSPLLQAGFDASVLTLQVHSASAPAAAAALRCAAHRRHHER